jgi:hypothetical protein
MTVLSVLAVGAMAGLTGCFKLDMSLELQPDNTVDGSVIIAVARDQASLLGGEDAIRQSLKSDTSELFSDAPGQGNYEQRDYEDADWIGTEGLFSDVPIDEFASEGSEDNQLSITRDGDEYVIEGSLNLSTGQDDTQLDASTQAVVDSAQIDISITFPGDVAEANGDIDGDTVTWHPRPGDVVDLTARGSATSGIDWALIAAIGALVALVVIGVVLLLVVRRREAVGDPRESEQHQLPPPDAEQPSV